MKEFEYRQCSYIKLFKLSYKHRIIAGYKNNDFSSSVIIIKWILYFLLNMGSVVIRMDYTSNKCKIM